MNETFVGNGFEENVYKKRTEELKKPQNALCRLV